MKLHRYRIVLCAACCFVLALVAAGPGSAAGATITITSIDQLQMIGDNASYPLDGAYELGGDIDASATSTWNDNGGGGYYGFAPIGPDESHPFTGTFDGKGHAISKLYINRPGTTDYVGLFGYANGATLKNINLDNATVTGYNQTGSLVGEIDYGFLINCSATGAVNGYEEVGGLAGYTYFGSVTGCSSAATVTGSSSEVGGLVGYNYFSAIASCSATGDVTGSSDDVGGLIGYNDYGPITSSSAAGKVTGSSDVGGLAGYSEYCTIDNCSATGAVTGGATGSYAGGLVGYPYMAYLTNCHATGKVTGYEYIGGLAGYAEYGSFTNCYATGDVTGSYYFIGGLAGYIDYTTLSSCYATGAVTGSGEEVGGLLGYIEDAKIINCYATGDVSGSDYYVGGLVGYNDYTDITNSYATGAVTGTDEYVGGLIGYGEAGNITGCYATGAVTGLDHYVGGLLGYNEYSDIRTCYATGAVTGAGTYIGGLVGYNAYNTIADCYATGAVTGSDNASTYISSYVGGLVGGNNEATIATSYSAGAVSGNDNATLYSIGGLVGNNDEGVVTACFWDTQTSGQATSDGGTGKTTAEMKTKATFTAAGWNFTTIWDIDEGVTYPSFRPVNKPPVASSDNYTTRRNTTLAVTKENGVLKNDTDPEGDSLTAVLVSGTTNGFLALNADGSFVYVPDKRFRGDDTFTYKAFDGELYSPAVSVTIAVGWHCPAAKLYGETSGQVKLLRQFRDTVLGKTAAGKFAVEAYYQLAPVVNAMLDNSPYLSRKTMQTIDMLLPAIQSSMK